MRGTALGGLLAAGFLAGCVHERAAPLDTARYPAAFAARRLEQKPPGVRWSGADLLSAALARNASVAEANARYRTALAAARTARVRPPLGLSLTAEYASQSPHWGYAGALDIPLGQGGRRVPLTATADLAALQALYDYGEAVWAARTAIDRARASLHLADEQLLLAQRAVSLRRDRFERLNQRVERGEDARSFSLVARSELTAAERRLTDLQGQRDQARLALAKAIGVDAGQADTLAVEPVAANPDLTSLSAWRGEAALSRRDVLRAVTDYDLAEAALRLEIARQFPDVRISPGFNFDHGVTKLPFNISLVLPPADMNRAAIAQAEAKRAEASRALETLQANALAGVDQSRIALTQAQQQQRRVVELDLPTARRLAMTATASMRAGETDRIDELAAEAAAVETEMTLIDTQRAALTAVVDLEDALRRPFDPAEAVVLQAALTTIGDPK